MKTPPFNQLNAQPEAGQLATSVKLEGECSSVYIPNQYSEKPIFGGCPSSLNYEQNEWNERLQRVRAMRFDHLRFLLVDDSADNQKLFQRILVAAGASVDIAENGNAAINCVREYDRYDLIIMDIRMPIVDGYEATRQIRALGYTRPIVALTAHATPGEEEKCRAAGCSDFQLKPIDRLSLLTAVGEAMAKAPAV